MHKDVNAILKAVKFIQAVEEKLIPEAEDKGGLLNIGVINGGTKPSTVPGECELFNTYRDVPVIILGPGYVECCHALDERIPVDHLPKAALIYALTAIEFCKGQK